MGKETPAGVAFVTGGKERMAGGEPSIRQPVHSRYYPRNDRVSGKKCLAPLRYPVRRCRYALELANDDGVDAGDILPLTTQSGTRWRRLECGGVFINGYCAATRRVATGGVKRVKL